MSNGGRTSKAGGIRLNGEKFLMVSFDTDKNLMYLKKNGGGGAVAKSSTGYCLSIWNATSKETVTKDGKTVTNPQNAGHCNLGVEKLQEFLVTNNL